jgi:hypothetical protein
VILCDLDDFCDDARSLADLRRLDELRAVIPTFKATLFTIGGRCSKGFIADIKASRPWLELVAHGWMHQTNRECEQWNADVCRQALAASRALGLTTRGFKAPGWQISDGCYEALLDEGYWIADQHYNDARQPYGMPAYRLHPRGALIHGGTGKVIYRAGQCDDSPGGVVYATQIHGHLGHLGGHNANALEIIAPQILAAAEHDTDFRFISEVME